MKELTLENLVTILDSIESDYQLESEIVEIDEENYVKVVSRDLEDFPIIARIEKITEEDENARIIFQSTLFNKKELSKTQINEINEEFLRMNPILNLSALGLVGDSYVIYGELSASSTDENILLEVDSLIFNLLEVLENIVERIELLSDYEPENGLDI